MTSNPTYQLLLVLVLAAVLGIVIGAALMQIRAVHAKAKLAQRHQVSVEKLRNQLADLESRHAALQRAGKAENQALWEMRNKEGQAAAQHDALHVHSRLQAQRIVNLEASLLAAEERGLRLQRDFESYKNHKQQELAMSRRSAAHWQSEGRAESDLPVLNKRVSAAQDVEASAAVQPAAASVQAMRALFDQDAGIPELEESELIGSINDISFDFEMDKQLEKLLEDEADPVG